MAGSDRLQCPNCASTNIERTATPPPPRDEGDVLTSDVTPPAEEPPNMRCNACGHTWWAPPRARP